MIYELSVRGNLGSFLKTKREIKKLTQSQLGEKTGYHTTSIGRWERGEQFPTTDELENLLEVLDAELVIRDRA